MIRFRNFMPLMVAALVGAATLGAPTRAQAGFSMTISESGGPSVTINDNDLPLGTASDSASQLGRIIFNGSVGDFDFQVSVGTSNAPGTANLAQLTINNLSISTLGFAGDKTVTVTLSDTGFMTPTGVQGLISQLSSTQLPTGSSISYQSSVTAGGPPVLGSLLSLSTVGGTSANNSVNITTAPYTLTSVTTYTVHGAGVGNTLTVQTTGLTAVVVPAPAGAVLALTGVPCMSLGCWLRRRLRKA